MKTKGSDNNLLKVIITGLYDYKKREKFNKALKAKTENHEAFKAYTENVLRAQEGMAIYIDTLHRAGYHTHKLLDFIEEAASKDLNYCLSDEEVSNIINLMWRG